MKITFHGAVRTVTGSLHLVQTARGDLLLVDCGLFQGRRQEARERNTTFPVEPSRIKAVVLTHSHIDHIGNLPTWVARGLRCPVFGTAATVDLCALMLRDSANIQVSDARHVNKHIKRGEKPVEPLYTPDHAEAAIKLLRGCNYRKPVQVLPGLRATFFDAGHILGSSSVVLEEAVNGTIKRAAFTGDVGRPNSPILRDAEPFTEGTDAVITESTYGDREHPPQAELPEELRKVLYATIARGGKLIVPAFAIGRTQMLLYFLRELQRSNKLPEVPVFVDSPLANSATELFARHPECYDTDAESVLQKDGVLFALEGYTPTRSTEESKALNEKKGPFVVIAASGMCEAGRILHHLDHGLGDPRNTVLIVGFQAENTLGRRLVERQERVRVFGQERQVRAEVQVINGFSAHAGRSELTAHLERCRPRGPVFLVHGDEARAQAFEGFLKQRGFPDVRVPQNGEEWRA